MEDIPISAPPQNSRWYNDKTLRTNVVVSIVVGLSLIYLIQPMVDGGLWLLSKAPTALFNSVWTIVCARAAAGHPWTFTSSDASYFFAMLITGLNFILLRLISILSAVRKPAESIPDTNEPTSSRPVLSGRFIIMLWFLFAVSVCWLLFLVFDCFTIKASISVRSAFRRRLEILSPHLTLDEEQRLVADFASMQTSDDYFRIKREMDSMAESNEVKFWPKVRP